MKTVKYRKSIGIILTIACGFTSLTNTGCDDFLSEKEVPRITSDFYKTEQGDRKSTRLNSSHSH